MKKSILPKFISAASTQICVGSVAALLALATTAHAATVNWTGATGGDWNTGGNWSGSAKPATADLASFNTTLASVTNAVADQTVQQISFDTNAGTANGTFTLGTTGGNKLTLNSAFGTQVGIQILSTLAGTGKTISVNAPLSLASSTYIVANNSADSSNTLNFGGAISAGAAGTVTLSLAGANTGANTISGAITNGSATTFNLTKDAIAGAGTWILSGANTYNGNTTINNGILQLNAGAGGSLNSASTLKFNGGYNSAFILDNTGASGAISQSLTMGSVANGDSVIQINRVAAQNLTLTLSTFTSPANQATLNYVTSGTPGVNGTDSKIAITGQGAGFLQNNVYFNGSNFARYDAAGYVRGINYGVDGSSATSSGATSIASPATYQRVTGAVTAQNTASFPNLVISGANDFTLAASQTVTLTSLIKSGGGATTISGGSGITLSTGNNYFRVDSASDSLTVSNAIGGSGRFVKSGKGTLILSGNNNYSAELDLNDGVVNIQNANALGTTAGNTTLKGGALQIQGGITVTGETLNLAGMGVNNDGALRNISGNNTWTGNISNSTDLGARINSDSGTLTISGNITLGGAGFINIFGGAGNILVSGNITNNGPKVLKDGSGTLTLTGVNTWNSGFTIQEGVVSIATINNAGASGPLGTGSPITMGGTGTAGTLSYTGATASSNMTFALNAGGGNFEVTNAATTLTLSGQMATSTGGLTKSGPGTLYLSSRYNIYPGVTTINGGTLQVNRNYSIGGTTPQLILNGGALYTMGTDGLFTLTTSSSVTLGSGGGTFRTDSITPLTIQCAVSGNGSLTKTDNGTLTLSGANTFSGATTVSAGTLVIGNNLALQNSALDTTGAGVVTTTGFTTPTFGGLKGGTNLSSVITTGYSSVTALTLNPGTGVTNTYSGTIANGASNMTLTKTGLGTQELSGNNSYTGATTVSAGKLIVSGSLSGSKNVSVSSGATLQLNDGGLIVTTGTVSVAGSGTLALQGSSTVGKLTLANGSTLATTITGTAAGSHGTVTVSNGLSLSGSTSVTLSINSSAYTPVYTAGGLAGSDKIALTLGGYTANDKFTNVVSGVVPGYESCGALNTFTDASNHTWAVFYGVNFGTTTDWAAPVAGSDIALLAVPEPSTWAMALGGFGMLVSFQRMRRRAPRN
ncbi:MAG: autotransporter-associated beta strand repeat-containing protein [Verrucomicrobiota bacterium]